MTKKIFYFFLLASLTACLHTEETPNSLLLPVTKEKAWKTLVEIFKDYPLKTINEDLGYIETEVIKGSHVWKPPHQKKKDFSGYSYILQVSLQYNSPISTITINKKVYKQKGFISQKQEIPSDRLEETALLYQINRELEIQALLKMQTQ